MKIKTKLLLGLCTLPILIFLLIIVGWVQVASLYKISNNVQTNYETYYLTEQIYRDIKEEAISLRNILLFEDNESFAREFSTLAMKSEAVDQHITLLESQPNTTEQKRIMIQELKFTNERFNEYKENVLQLHSEGKREELLHLINTTGLPLQDEFFAIVSQISTSFGDPLNNSLDHIAQDFRNDIVLGSIISLTILVIVAIILFKNIYHLANRLRKVSNVMLQVASGKLDLSTRVEVKASDEIDDVAYSFNKMVETLDEEISKEQNQLWVKSNVAEVTTSLSGTHNLESLSKTFLSKVVPLIDSCHAVFYMKDSNGIEAEPVYKLLAYYAFKEREHLSNTFRAGEGLIGQAILEKSPIILTNVPSDYIRVTSESAPLNIYVLPVIFEGDVKAVVEFASFQPFNDAQETLLEEVISGLGIILDNVIGRNQIAKLLEESQALMEEVQAQSEELQSQQEELRVTNEELEEQTIALRQSEEKLQMQQEELEQTNMELEEKAESLVEQNRKYELTNKEIEIARAELEEKARQLALSSKYKSEFLANMSHELRTPLNSLLILSKLLSENQEGNLTKKQVEYSKIIHSSGSDLLALINEILDLSKIESGKIDVTPKEVLIENIIEFVENSFRPVSNEKKLDFAIVVKSDLPKTIYSDEQRLQQVLNNLLSNAFKFTHKGKVTLEIGYSYRFRNQSFFSFSVVDTGIGIPQDKLELIFQAFQQADGTTSRRYGGTGLGLSISRQIATILGGEIVVESEQGIGSRFTFYVNDYKEKVFDSILEMKEIAVTNEVQQSKETETIKPLHLEEQPQRLKEEIEFYLNSDTEIEENEQAELIELKPISGLEGKEILLVDDDIRNVYALSSVLELYGMNITYAENGVEGLEVLEKHSRIDLVLMDIMMAEMDGYETIQRIRANPKFANLPVIALTAKAMKEDREKCMEVGASDYIVKPFDPDQLISLIRVWLYATKEK